MLGILPLILFLPFFLAYWFSHWNDCINNNENIKNIRNITVKIKILSSNTRVKYILPCLSILSNFIALLYQTVAEVSFYKYLQWNVTWTVFFITSKIENNSTITILDSNKLPKIFKNFMVFRDLEMEYYSKNSINIKIVGK